MLILLLILIIYIFGAYEHYSYNAKVSGGGVANNYYEQQDVNTTKYHIAPFNAKYALGDLTVDYPVHPFCGNRCHNWTGDKITHYNAKAHWGQRKLLLSEVDFLNRLDPNKKYTVVYAGAADGRHMPILTDMFPNITLHLYDPRDFYPGIANNRILLNPHSKNKYFTDETAKYYKTFNNLVFISDIRTDPKENETMMNQEMQQHWVQIMQPHLSMLKFKLPYPCTTDCNPAYYKYLKGDIRLQCWAPSFTAETRLIVTDANSQANYPVNLYERNLSWYNCVMRVHDFRNEQLKLYNIPLDETFEILYKVNVNIGYDFVYETQIICDYLHVNKTKITLANVKEIIKKFNNNLIDDGSKFEYYLKGQGSHLLVDKN